jgi:hypothetical protein
VLLTACTARRHHDDLGFEAYQLGRRLREQVVAAVALVDQQVLAFNKAQVVQALAERRPRGGNPLAQAARREVGDPPDPGLLPAGEQHATARQHGEACETQASLKELAAIAHGDAALRPPV